MFTEIRKTVRPGLLAAFLGVGMMINLWFIWNESDEADLVRECGKIASEEGLYVDLSYLYDRLEIYENQFRQISIGRSLSVLTEMKEKLTMADIGDAYISNMKLKGQAADWAKKGFDFMVPVLENAVKSGHSDALFVPAGAEFFQFFSRKLVLVLTLEAVTAGVLLMLLTLDYESACSSEATVYVTKKGRKIMKTKLFAGLFAGFCFGSILWGITLVLIHIVFEPNAMWSTPVSSFMVTDSGYPVFANTDLYGVEMTVGGYICIQFILSMGITFVFGLGAFVFYGKLKNVYTAFIFMALLCAVIYTMCWFTPGNSWWWYILRYNPVSFIERAGGWLLTGAGFWMPKGYAVAAPLLWALLAAAISGVTYEKFLKEDL